MTEQFATGASGIIDRREGWGHEDGTDNRVRDDAEWDSNYDTEDQSRDVRPQTIVIGKDDGGYPIKFGFMDIEPTDIGGDTYNPGWLWGSVNSLEPIANIDWFVNNGTILEAYPGGESNAVLPDWDADDTEKIWYQIDDWPNAYDFSDEGWSVGEYLVWANDAENGYGNVYIITNLTDNEYDTVGTLSSFGPDSYDVPVPTGYGHGSILIATDGGYLFSNRGTYFAPHWKAFVTEQALDELSEYMEDVIGGLDGGGGPASSVEGAFVYDADNPTNAGRIDIQPGQFDSELNVVYDELTRGIYLSTAPAEVSVTVYGGSDQESLESDTGYISVYNSSQELLFMVNNEGNLVLTSPNGTSYVVSVNNSGELVVVGA